MATTIRGGTLYALLCMLIFRHAEGAHPTRLVYEYPHVGTWIENGAVRQNGSILLTSIDSPGGISSLNPFDGSAPVFLTNDFDYLNSTLGIVETIPDVFYVIASNFSLYPGAIGPQKNTNAIYEVDFACDPNSSAPAVSLLTRMPDAEFLNGLTKFNDTLLLAADSALGAVWSINTMTKEAEIAFTDPLMAPKPAPDGSGAEGINGLHLYDDILYFTNSNRMTFSKLQLSAEAKPIGTASLLATPFVEKGLTPFWDDFAIDATGSFAYVATEIGNSIQKVDLNTGHVVLFAGELNSTAIAEPTAVVFGRTTKDATTVYALTAGALAFPVYTPEGPKQMGAQVVAVNTIAVNITAVPG